MSWTDPRIVLAAAALLVVAWMLRFDVAAGSGMLQLFVIDRWTGQIDYCLGSACEPVRPAR